MRIAICDDSEGDRTRIADALAAYLKRRELSAEVKAFDHPDRLLESVRHEDFDIYLLDILMPMVSGVGTARELREMKGKVPIVFFTTSRDYALEAFGVKAVDYVLKPWTPAVFTAALDAAVAAVPRGEGSVWTVKTLTGIRRVRPELVTHVITSEDVRHVLFVHLEGGEAIKLRGSVVGVREELSKWLSLVSVGKSLLINPAYICAIEHTRIRFADGLSLEVPKSSISVLRAAMLAV